MKLQRRQFLHLIAGAAALPPVLGISKAQSDPKPAERYPTRPVRVIVPFAPGGSNDVFARLVSQKLGEQLGKQFYVENLPGASGNSGTAQAAKAAPDGYTVLMTGNNLVISPSFFGKVPYDPLRDFDPVSLSSPSPVVLSINHAVPANTVTELVRLIRANPGKYNFASGGTGSLQHLAAEKFRSQAALDVAHIPFNGGGPAVASAIAGHTPIVFSQPPQIVPFVENGTLRALAVMSNTRSQALPDVPTMAEAGYPDLEVALWVGILVPAGTPKDIIALLNREIGNVVARPETKERLVTLGFEPSASTPEEFAARMRGEIGTWAKVIAAGNIRPQ
jgi:tripartite-type tricarboxylate transporter receptor subunit TctC